MKTLLRHFFMNLAALYGTSFILPGLTYTGGIRTLALGALGLMVLNMMIVPLLKVMFLPLNLLTLGLFTWVINVVALYLLTTFIPQIKITPYFFPGTNLNGFAIPSMEMSTLQVAIVASFLVGLISHLLTWICDK
jgi:putative membrane protein